MNAGVIPAALAQSSLVPHPAFFHHVPGVGVGHIVPGVNAQVALAEQVINHSGKGLAHNALMPPLPAQAVAGMGLPGPVIPLHHGDIANGLAQLLELDGPVVVIPFFILADPAVDDLLAHVYILVGRPGQVLGNLRVMGPVLIHRLCILQGEAAQNQPFGFQDGGAAVPEPLGVRAARPPFFRKLRNRDSHRGSRRNPSQAFG